MLKFLKKEANLTLTENEAVTYLSTLSDCLDLFATIGALRHKCEAEIIARFDRAYAENANAAMKTIFFARDIRGGLGERRVFRVLLKHIGNTYSDSAKRNIEYIAEYGRYDDLLVLIGTCCEAEVFTLIKEKFDSDMKALDNNERVSLLGKWLPSINASSRDTVLMGKRIAHTLGLNEKQYRQALTRLRASINIIENSLRLKSYNFNYSMQPSKAMLKYRKAFLRNDGERYRAFLEAVSRGEAKLNTGTLLPYEIITPLFGYQSITDIERKSMDVTWRALEDFTGGENALVVVDGSGSMYGSTNPVPAAVAMSLGIYFAERNKGAFHNHFVTFSTNPRLVEIKGADIFEKVKYCSSYNEIANTDLQKVFELILRTAVKNRLPQSELPETLYIISDMEFDSCMNNADATNFENAKDIFAKYGYSLPRVVFWNVQSRNNQQPVTTNEQGVALVSGTSPRIFSMIKTGTLTPYAFMMETLESERYKKITA